MHFSPIPGCISRCPQGAVSHNDNTILPAIFKQLWLSEIGMALNLFLKKKTQILFISSLRWLWLGAFGCVCQSSLFLLLPKVEWYLIICLIFQNIGTSLTCLYLIWDRFVFQPRFVKNQLQLSLVEVGYSKRFYKASIFAGLQSLAKIIKIASHSQKGN